MRSSQLHSIVAALFAASVAATAAAQPDPPRRAPCPAAVPGTEVHTANVAGGITLTFTTTGDVPELQRRVQTMADNHNRRQHPPGRGTGGGGGAGHGPGAGGMGPHGMGMLAQMPIATRTVTELPQGARITVRPDDPKELEALRASVRMHAKHLKMGHCEPPAQPSDQPAP